MKTFDELNMWLVEAKANSLKHSGRTFIFHLNKVYSLLKNLGYSEAICNAGLFHSVYKEEFNLSIMSEDNRGVLSEMISEEAEELVWMFSNLKRQKAFKEYISDKTIPVITGLNRVITEADMEILLAIEVANYLDQKILWMNSYLIPFAIKIGMVDSNGWGIDRSSSYIDYVSDVAKLSIEPRLNSGCTSCTAIIT